ncbi:MAG: efflux RND transporter permease subunit [Hahellaceae bacterium]|nr:efflux RND transporter permease subunit [Hahellaceae bacterium]
MSAPKFGIAGRLASAFQSAQITPLLALVGLLLGLFAVLITPKEEEPQIDVTFANIFVPFPGSSPREVEQLVSVPAEQVLSEIDGVEHVYAVSQPGLSVLTVQFKVGVPRQDALVKLYNQVYSNQDWLPANLGTLPPLIKPKGIDDVPIMGITLWSGDPSLTAVDLRPIAHTLESELKRVPGTRDIYTVGAPAEQVTVELDPVRMSAYGLDYMAVRGSLEQGNSRSALAAGVADGERFTIQAGAFLSTPQDLATLVVGASNGQPILLQDIAAVRPDNTEFANAVRLGFGPASPHADLDERPALTLALAKQPGVNAVEVTRQVEARLQQLKGVVIPDSVEVLVTRDYGQTAAEKSSKLIMKLVFATSAVILLVLFALGLREALIVGLAIVVTLALTLFASWAWGFTLNRVSLFALIFSIGILVDDAIVVVENIHRHLSQGQKSLLDAIPLAVDEVGGATILATFTVIAALMPMAFVSGLMGPYMSPIPINASMGMLISLLVAFIVTPWLAARLMRSHTHAKNHGQGLAMDAASNKDDRLSAAAGRAVAWFVDPVKGRRRRHGLYLACLLGVALTLLMPVYQWVILKMLPFDNKSEIQVVVDMPENTPVETTLAALQAIAKEVARVEEVDNYQLYAGASAPINFNGLVRQYYLRRAAYQGDIQINLVDKHARQRDSHAIAKGLRAAVQQAGAPFGANVKVVEVPPGPPVQAPLVAEVYGYDEAQRQQISNEVMAVLRGLDGIVDVDSSMETPVTQWVFEVDREKAARLGIPYSAITQTLSAVTGISPVTYLRNDRAKYAVPVVVDVSDAVKTNPEQLLSMPIQGGLGGNWRLSEVVTLHKGIQDAALYRKDLLPVIFVTADMAGELDSPLYGMFEAVAELEKASGSALGQQFIRPPTLDATPSIKWDGEWQVTYETFRDMGIAYGVGMVLIYLLVVAQFGSYRTPLVIMAPIALTLLGVMPGHALLGAQFTATSMIGMIALAGIIVRNSILLVDFAREEHARGVPFRQAIIRSSAVRTKPILLTAFAAVLGAFFILDDPIFNGLAISLIFGILVSSLLTLVVIPVAYYALYRKRLDNGNVPT